jgi:hypothetical protein
MKAIITAAAAALVVAGAFAQVQTGEPSNGSKLGVTPPPSTSVTTDTSRLATDCDKVAADQRANQAGGAALGSAGCASRTTTMGATTATPAVVAQPATPAPADTSTASSTTTTTNSTAMSNDTTNSVAQADTAPAPKKARKARADRG